MTCTISDGDARADAESYPQVDGGIAVGHRVASPATGGPVATPSSMANTSAGEMLSAIRRLLASLPSNDDSWKQGLIDTDRLQRHLDHATREYQKAKQDQFQNSQQSDHPLHTQRMQAVRDEFSSQIISEIERINALVTNAADRVEQQIEAAAPAWQSPKTETLRTDSVSMVEDRLNAQKIDALQHELKKSNGASVTRSTYPLIGSNRRLPPPINLFDRRPSVAPSVASTASNSSIRKRGVPSEIIRSAHRLVHAIDDLDTLSKVELINVLGLIIFVQEFDDRLECDIASELLPTLDEQPMVAAGDSKQAALISQLRRFVQPLLKKHVIDLELSHPSPAASQSIKQVKQEMHDSEQQLCARCQTQPLPAIILQNCQHRLCLRCLSQTPNENASCPACRAAILYHATELHPETIMPGLKALSLHSAASASQSMPPPSMIPNLPPIHVPSIAATTVAPSDSESDTACSVRDSSVGSVVSHGRAISESPSADELRAAFESHTSSAFVSREATERTASELSVGDAAAKQELAAMDSDDDNNIVTLAPSHFASPAEPAQRQLSPPVVSHNAGPAAISRTLTADSSNAHTEGSDFDEGSVIPTSEGYSCHQCKTSKKPKLLAFCTNTGVGRRKRSCHKKFCNDCMKWRYQQDIYSMSRAERQRWMCPSCAGICSCAACVRKREQPASTLSATPSVVAPNTPSQSSPSSVHLANTVQPVTYAALLQQRQAQQSLASPYNVFQQQQQMLAAAAGYQASNTPPSSSALGLPPAHPLFAAPKTLPVTSPQVTPQMYNAYSAFMAAQSQPASQYFSTPPPPLFGPTPINSSSFQASQTVSLPTLESSSLTLMHGSSGGSAVTEPLPATASQQQLYSSAQSTLPPSVASSPHLYAMAIQQQQQQIQYHQAQLLALQQQQAQIMYSHQHQQQAAIAAAAAARAVVAQVQHQQQQPQHTPLQQSSIDALQTLATLSAVASQDTTASAAAVTTSSVSTSAANNISSVPTSAFHSVAGHTQAS